MSELISRLRNDWPQDDNMSTMLEAADRIEQLQAELSAYRNCHESAPSLLRDNFRLAEEAERGYQDYKRIKDLLVAADNRIAELETQLAGARALIERHECALEWLSETPDYDSLHKNWQSKMYALCKISSYPQGGLSMAMKTPLAAIEAAKGEGK